MEVELAHGKPSPWMLDLRVELRALLTRAFSDTFQCLSSLGVGDSVLRLLPLKASLLGSPKRVWLACLAVTSVALVWLLTRMSVPSSASASLFLLLPSSFLSSCTEPPHWSNSVQWSTSEEMIGVARASHTYNLPPRCPIFTFFEPVQQLASHHADKRVDAWKAWYYSRGWQPVVLSLASAMTLPRAADYHSAFSALPTVNPKEYELNCYLRWMAIAQRPGGGLFLDYDIFDMTTPDAATYPELSGSCSYGALTTYANHRPMITHGNASQLLAWVQYMTAYQLKPSDRVGERPHISDMLIARHLDPALPYQERPPVPWFHFSHYALDRLKPYAPDQQFQNRILHLQFLASHRMHLVGGGATRVLGEALGMCALDEWTEDTEMFCHFPWVLTEGNATHYVEPRTKEEFRTELCSTIRRKPWKLSDIACRYHRGMKDFTTSTAEEAAAAPFIVAVVVDPVVQAVKAMLAQADAAPSEAVNSSTSIVSPIASALHQLPLSKSANDPAWLSALYRTAPNPFLFQLTEHLPPCTPASERWATALTRVSDVRSSVLIAEVDLGADAHRLRAVVSRYVGFDVVGIEAVWGQMVGERCEGECKEVVASLTQWQVDAVRAWHVLDVELLRVVQERFAAREAEWGRT